jgi:hypothetical protein
MEIQDDGGLRQVLESIRDAFPASALNPERICGNQCATYEEVEEFKSGLRGKTWSSLDADFLDRHHDILFFLTPEGFLELLPAFLVTSVDNFERRDHLAELVSSMLQRDMKQPASLKAFEERVAMTMPAQRHAVTLSLQYLERRFASAWRENPARDALDSYWLAASPIKEGEK